MKCCIDCFSSNYLRSIIETSFNTLGKCDFCLNDNVIIFDPAFLFPYFSPIFDLYTAETTLATFEPKTIEFKILKDFDSKIFKLVDPPKVRKLLLQIIGKTEIDINISVTATTAPLSLFKYPCHFKHYLGSVSPSVLNDSWDLFVNEIKNENRFHLKNAIDLSRLAILLKRYSKEIKKGTKYFRARISDKSGYPISQMGSPPPHLAKAGRANPGGISYLYLSNDTNTTLYETRASLYDFVTIGEFELTEDINIINLRETDLYDPIYLSDTDDLEDFLIHYPFIARLEDELSRPARKSDNYFDYLPTQYLSEFIKSLDFAGVEFKSSLNPHGHNLVVFKPSLFNCIDCKVHEVKNINYTFIAC